MPKSRKLRIYFAHPICEYGTQLEKSIVKKISSAEWEYGIEVINPADRRYQGEFKKYKEKHPESYMQYWLDLAKTCKICVGMPFLNGQWGMGVWAEMNAIRSCGGETYQAKIMWCSDGPKLSDLELVDIKDIEPMSVFTTQATLRMIKHYKEVRA